VSDHTVSSDEIGVDDVFASYNLVVESIDGQIDGDQTTPIIVHCISAARRSYRTHTLSLPSTRGSGDDVGHPRTILADLLSVKISCAETLVTASVAEDNRNSRQACRDVVRSWRCR